MSVMEKSLRRALEAGDANDPAFRESIYAASERALERMIAAKPVDEAAAHLQRTRLAETINLVEDDFYARQTAAGGAADGPAQHDPELSLDPAYTDAHSYSTHGPGDGSAGPGGGEETFELRPVFDGAEDADGPAKAMMVVPAGASEATGVSEPVRPSTRVRSAEAVREATRAGNTQLRRFGVLVLAVALVLGIGAYIVYASTGGGGGDDAASETNGDRWIDLFDGQRLDAVSTPNGGRMVAIGADAGAGRPAVRFTPAAGTSAIAVAVGPGVVSTIAGRKVLVELAAGSPDGTTRGFTVECRLGEAEVCGRQSFTTSRRNETFVFDMDVPQDASGGGLAITPAVKAPGEPALDIYAVRLRGT